MRPGLAKGILVAMVAWLAICHVFPAYSQVEMSLQLDHSVAIRFEPVVATVTVVNRSGKLFSVGGTNTSADLEIFVTRDGGVMPDRKSSGGIQETFVMPGERKAIAVNVGDLLDLSKAAIYKISAILRVGGQSFVSNTETLQVIKGFEISRTRTSAPGSKGGVTTYVLNFIKREGYENLFLCVKDEGRNVVYGVFDMGLFLRVREPVLVSDADGNAHILFDTQNATVHTCFTPYGVQLFADVFANGKSRIELSESTGGDVKVVKKPLETKLMPLPE